MPDNDGRVAWVPAAGGDQWRLPGAPVDRASTWATAGRLAAAALGRAAPVAGLPAIYVDEEAPVMTLLFSHAPAPGTSGNASGGGHPRLMIRLSIRPTENWPRPRSSPARRRYFPGWTRMGLTIATAIAKSIAIGLPDYDVLRPRQGLKLPSARPPTTVTSTGTSRGGLGAGAGHRPNLEAAIKATRTASTRRAGRSFTGRSITPRRWPGCGKRPRGPESEASARRAAPRWAPTPRPASGCRFSTPSSPKRGGLRPVRSVITLPPG